MKKTVYHWQSNYTGEIVPKFRNVLQTIYWYIKNLSGFSSKMFSWNYSKEGF